MAEKTIPMSLEARLELVLRLRQEGLSYLSIGEVLGISTQQAHALVQAGIQPINGLLSTMEAAQRLRIHPNTLRRWSKQGILKCYRLGTRGDRRFSASEITDFLQQRKTK